MPAERINAVKRTVVTAAAAGPITSKGKVLKTKAPAAATATAVAIEALDPAKKPVAIDEDIATVHLYPKSQVDRENAVNRHTGRKVTPFQFQVYDLCAQIPKGHISTYKYLSDALHSSPRAVGQALKINPYAPLPVPCHRVLDSKLFIGGFMGQWAHGEKIDNKKAKLYLEGVAFDETDHVVKREDLIFNDFSVVVKAAVDSA
ncbi:hypothetical protein EC957_012351 [Mortierella hygrophila]|uniref:Methylated-DNA--protein-cysteine methyltransferase n=1 Tax=Mortierella hygrophila TaxID=979708 RepID=A0A9P6K395_9FUNG|nr:hypothetical protein EC957_012351 [Mortierella hygrophila]